MMRRRTVFALIIALMLGLVVLAIAVIPTVYNPAFCRSDIPPEEDMQQAVSYGAAFEAASWQMEAANHEGSVSVRWFDESGLEHVDYLRYNCGLSEADLDNYQFGISLGGYDSWEETRHCDVEGLRLHEFAVVYDGDQDYRVRFWLKPVNDTRLLAFQLSFPAARQNDLETYAQRLFPELSACV